MHRHPPTVLYVMHRRSPTVLYPIPYPFLVLGLGLLTRLSVMTMMTMTTMMMMMVQSVTRVPISLCCQ